MITIKTWSIGCKGLSKIEQNRKLQKIANQAPEDGSIQYFFMDDKRYAVKEKIVYTGEDVDLIYNFHLTKDYYIRNIFDKIFYKLKDTQHQIIIKPAFTNYLQITKK
mgnify:FL=1